MGEEKGFKSFLASINSSEQLTTSLNELKEGHKKLYHVLTLMLFAIKFSRKVCRYVGKSEKRDEAKRTDLYVNKEKENTVRCVMRAFLLAKVNIILFLIPNSFLCLTN